MIHVEKEYLGVMMEAGYIYMGMRRFKDARTLFEGLVVLAPDSDIPLVALGNVDFCDGRVSKAIVNYNLALKKNPSSLFAMVYKGEALFFAGKKDEAVELLNYVAKKDKTGAGDFARALLAAIKKGFKPKKK